MHRKQPPAKAAFCELPVQTVDPGNIKAKLAKSSRIFKAYPWKKIIYCTTIGNHEFLKVASAG